MPSRFPGACACCGDSGHERCETWLEPPPEPEVAMVGDPILLELWGVRVQLDAAGQLCSVPVLPDGSVYAGNVMRPVELAWRVVVPLLCGGVVLAVMAIMRS